MSEMGITLIPNTNRNTISRQVFDAEWSGNSKSRAYGKFCGGDVAAPGSVSAGLMEQAIRNFGSKGYAEIKKWARLTKMLFIGISKIRFLGSHN